MICHRPPFYNEDVQKMYAEIMSGEVDCRGLDESSAVLVKGLLQRDPNNRFGFHQVVNSSFLKTACDWLKISKLRKRACSFVQRKVSLDDFELTRLIGVGGFGKTFEVKMKSNEQLYALKVLNKSPIISRGEVEHTRAEKHVLITLQENVENKQSNDREEEVSSLESKSAKRSFLDLPCLISTQCPNINPSILRLGKKWLLNGEALENLEEERNKAVDLLDLLTKSGVFSVDDIQFHVWLNFVQNFKTTVMELITKQNLNPIELVEEQYRSIWSILETFETE